MSTSVTSVTKHFPSAQDGFTTTLSGTIAAGATTVGLNSLTGYTTGEVAVFVVAPTSTSEKQTFTGTVDTAGLQITNVVWTSGTNQTHTAGTTVVDYATATHMSMLSKGLKVEHNQNGTHSNINATSITATTGTFTNLTISGSASSEGWAALGSTPNTITYNGNRNYDVVFNSTDLTTKLTPGMKLQLTRTVAAADQCTDLESGSSQYFTKSSPSGITFTDDWSASAWIKLESYTGTRQVIINKSDYTNQGFGLAIDSSGRLEVGSFRIAGNNSVTTSYASVPLNKWVHVAATTDLSGTSVITYIDGVAVPSTTTISGTITALVQYSGDLRIGALSSSASQYFDGKIAQVALFNAVLSATTIRSYASQGLSGSESSLISAYSFDNSINDLNTTNANNLTANGSAVATNADSPFANAVSAGLQEYAEIQSVSFSTNTTVNVRVPDTCMIPTSGGVSNVYYAVGANPYGLPYFSNELVAYYFKAGASNVASGSNVNGFSITYTLAANTKYRLSIRGFQLGLFGGATAVCATFVRIREGSTVIGESGIVVQESALGNSSTHTVTTHNFTPTTGSHTYVGTITNSNAQAMTYSGVASEGIAFILEKA